MRKQRNISTCVRKCRFNRMMENNWMRMKYRIRMVNNTVMELICKTTKVLKARIAIKKVRNSKATLNLAAPSSTLSRTDRSRRRTFRVKTSRPARGEAYSRKQTTRNIPSFLLETRGKGLILIIALCHSKKLSCRFAWMNEKWWWK